MQKITFTRNKKILYSAIILVIVFSVFMIRSCGKKKDRTFYFEKASIGEVKKTISVTGTLELIDSKNVLSKMSGIAERVLVDFNDSVRKDQLLATLESADAEQQLLKIKATLDVTELEIDGAKKEYETSKELYKENLISKQGMEQAEFKYKSVVNKFKQTQIDYNVAVRQKSYTRIYSPVSGIVMSSNIAPNNPVAINSILFVIAPSMKKMHLTINVDEADIGTIKTGQSVQFSVSAFPDKTFTGKVVQVRMTPVPKGGIITYQALAVCDNDDLMLKPGMTATATVIVDVKSKVLRAPNQAFLVSPVDIVYEKGKKYIWKKTSGIGAVPASRIEVKTGLVGDMFTEIKEKVKDGDELLVRISEGDGKK